MTISDTERSPCTDDCNLSIPLTFFPAELPSSKEGIVKDAEVERSRPSERRLICSLAFQESFVEWNFGRNYCITELKCANTVMFVLNHRGTCFSFHGRNTLYSGRGAATLCNAVPQTERLISRSRTLKPFAVRTADEIC